MTFKPKVTTLEDILTLVEIDRLRKIRGEDNSEWPVPAVEVPQHKTGGLIEFAMIEVALNSIKKAEEKERARIFFNKQQGEKK